MLPREERALDSLALLAIVVAAAFHAYRAADIQSPVITDEYEFLLAGLSYGDMQWAIDYSLVPQWGTHLYVFLISLMAGLPSIPTLLKIVNAGAVAVAGMATYATLKSLDVTPARRVLFALFLVALPSVSYVTFVTADSLYGSAFWILICAFVYVVLTRRLSELSGAALLGIGAGFLTLIKPHGFFVYLAAAAALVCVTAPPVARSVKPTRMLAGILALSLGYALAAVAGNWLTAPAGAANPFDLVGGYYADWLRARNLEPGNIRAMLAFFAGEYCAVMALYAPALLAAVIGVIRIARLKSPAPVSPSERRWLIFSGLFLVFLLSGLVLMMTLFHTSLGHLQLRYFNFMFPALAFLVFVFDSRRFHGITGIFNDRIVRIVMALVWLGCAVGLYFIARNEAVVFYSEPDLYFAYQKPLFGDVNMLGRHGLMIGVVWIALGGVLLAATTVSPIVINLAVLIPLNVVSLLNCYAAQGHFAARQAPYDRLGRIVADACPRWPRSIAVISTEDFWGAYTNVLFQLDRPALFLTTSDNGVYDPDHLHGLFPPSSRLSNPRVVGIIAQADCVLSRLDLDSRIFAPQLSIAGIHLYRIRADGRPLIRTSEDLRPVYTLGTIVDMSEKGRGKYFLGHGWSDQEKSGRRSIGDSAELYLLLAEPPPSGRDLTLTLQASAYGGQTVGLDVNGKTVGQQFIESEDGQVEFTVPADAVQSDRLRIVFRTPEAISPAAATPGETDTLALGLNLKSFNLRVDQPR